MTLTRMQRRAGIDRHRIVADLGEHGPQTAVQLWRRHERTSHLVYPHQGFYAVLAALCREGQIGKRRFPAGHRPHGRLWEIYYFTPGVAAVARLRKSHQRVWEEGRCDIIIGDREWQMYYPERADQVRNIKQRLRTLYADNDLRRYTQLSMRHVPEWLRDDFVSYLELKVGLHMLKKTLYMPYRCILLYDLDYNLQPREKSGSEDDKGRSLRLRAARHLDYDAREDGRPRTETATVKAFDRDRAEGYEYLRRWIVGPEGQEVQGWLEKRR